MATLVPKFDRVQPLTIPNYLLIQIFDILSTVGESTDRLQDTTDNSTFVSNVNAKNMADKIRVLLDNEVISVARFPCRWWTNQRAKILVLNSFSANDVIELINTERRHNFYFGHNEDISRIRESDISFERLVHPARTRVIEFASFAYTSRGFWVNWT